MNVLLVEPWFGGSHRQWAEGYAAHSRHEVTPLTLPDGGWKWRMRGAALTLARQVTRPPDVVLASSLLDLAAFLGHARRVLGDVPVLLYMHENQLTYPLPDGASRDTSLAVANWNAMAAADLVAFNSEYHRSVWFEALRPFLESFPEPTHTALIDEVEDTSVVLPVGIDLEWIAAPPPPERPPPERPPPERPPPERPPPERPPPEPPPVVVWNQRWEHDKNPDTVAAILAAVADARPDVRFGVCGENPRSSTPPAFTELAQRLGDRLVAFGHLERRAYEQLLNQSSVVLSAAHHEFFGVAGVEAMAAGAVPVFPDRLAYPELLDRRLPMWELSTEAVDLILEVVDDAGLRQTRADTAKELANRFSWRKLAPRYDELLEGLLGAAGG
jgi:glycosyltransferase involved in cell wall biosynthesis